MVITRDEALHERVVSLRNHGASSRPKNLAVDAPKYLLGDFEHIGFNYRMPDILGALGVTQMQKLPQMLKERQAQALRYDAGLRDLPWLKLPDCPENTTHSYQSYVCLYAPETPSFDRWEQLSTVRNRIMNILEAAGITTRQGTHAVHALEVYRNTFGYRVKDVPNAWLAENLSIALPIFPGMTEAQQTHVIDVLRGAHDKL